MFQKNNLEDQDGRLQDNPFLCLLARLAIVNNTIDSNAAHVTR